MGATATLGGVAEALFLITVTRAAFAITDGDDQIGIVAGRYLSVNEALLLAVVLVVTRVSLAVSTTSQGARLTHSVVSSVRRRLASAFLRTSWAVQQQQQGGSLQELMGGYAGQVGGVTSSINLGLVSSCNLVALIALAIAVDPVGALFLVGSVAVLGTVLRPLRAVVRRRGMRAAEAGMELSTSINETSTLGLELHVFNVQDEALKRTEQSIEQARVSGEKLSFATGLATPAYVGLAYLALLGALSFVSLSSATSLTSLGAAMLVMLRSLSYGQALQGAVVSVSGSAPVIDELRRRLDVLEQGHQEDGGEPVGQVGTLAVEHLSFAYVPGQGVLDDVSFAIQPREIVGIVGPSGSGKSTLVQLLLGLREPDGGRVLADGRDISRFGREDWARKVTFVPQAPHFVRGSVEDNIRFLRDGVSHDDIERAARLAHLHDDVCGFAEGYQRQVGDQGGHLSGGQQQRLTIARALVEQPDVLILDEPTSALDVRSEHLIRTTLLSLKDQMTVIVIAHRLSTLEICDRIMVIQAGRLMGFDTPTRLEKSNDFYRDALALSGMR